MDKKTPEKNVTGQIVSLRARTLEDELERLNRVTGLDFHAIPQSILATPEEEWDYFAEVLLGQAMMIWSHDG